jgi:hypothetical protein
MTVHQFDPDMLPDDEFLPGGVKYLVPGNECRLLDGRRTPGEIVQLDLQSAMFTWRINKFEDTGKEWCLPAEEVVKYQFAKGAQILKTGDLRKLQAAITSFQEPLIIRQDDATRSRTEDAIRATESSIRQWLKGRSKFFQQGLVLDFDAECGPEFLAEDLLRYMDENGFLEHEIKTSENMVLNPHSGEWIKGMEIALAEMGLVNYAGKIPRTRDIFKGIGTRNIRKSYLIHRLGFVRVAFHLLGMTEVVLFRGMSTEQEWEERTRTLLSSTFSLRVAKSFANFNREDKYLGAYLFKFTIPVERLFMTYLETKAMNQQYGEAEALVLFDPSWTWIP